MRLSLALLTLLAGVAAIVIAISMMITGMNHVFSTGGGATYYGIIIGLGAGGALVISIAWGALSSQD